MLRSGSSTSRHELTGAAAHNNGAHLTKMLTGKIEETENVSKS